LKNLGNTTFWEGSSKRADFPELSAACFPGASPAKGTLGNPDAEGVLPKLTKRFIDAIKPTAMWFSGMTNCPGMASG
jgi:hypothetical protein